ncbi:MAG: response regulator [Pseudomonadota bacterium]
MARILIANGDNGVSTFLRRNMERAGHAVLHVDDGRDALAALYQHCFDLFLTDVAIPGVDGVQLAQLAAQERPSMQVMLITGFSAVALSLKGETKATQTPILSKPFHLRQLAQHVDVVLSA